MKKTVQETINDLRRIIQENAINEIDVALHVATDLFIDDLLDYDVMKLRQIRERHHSLKQWDLSDEIEKGRII